MIARVLLGMALVVAITRSAHADGDPQPPKIAVLGLEVGGAVDLEATTVARNLTAQLRLQAAASPRFVVAPHSDKELFDEKLTSNCDTEAIACMVVIAKQLGAKRMLFGRLEKKQNNGPGYQVSLKLLDVDRHTMTPWSEFIPLAETAADLDDWASKAFTAITGQEEEAVVEPTPSLPPPPPEAEHTHNGWRISAYVSSGATVLLAGGFFYSWHQLAGLGKQGFFRYGKDCQEDLTSPTGFTATSNPHCVDGASWRRDTYVTGIGMAVVGSFAIVAIYKASRGRPAHRDEVTRKGAPRSRLAVTPVVSPGGAGAILRLDW
ncbi:MAG: hypothetical protein H6Q90_1569 [Deltaproteobacteria bacterium]|nr:hypothetical protein [Deltaproteobacteria bacterium]